MTTKIIQLGNPSGEETSVNVKDGILEIIPNDTLETIDYAHKMIHDGKSFSAHFSNAVTAINEQTMIAFTSPLTAEMHVIFQVQAAKSTTVSLYKNTAIKVTALPGTLVPVSRNQLTPGTSTIKSVGSAVPVINQISTYNEVQAGSGSAVTTSLLDQYLLVGGEGPKSFGAAGFRDVQEWVFGTAIQVAIVMNAETVDDDTHYIRMDWYEK